jgi:hypothetical protein
MYSIVYAKEVMFSALGGLVDMNGGSTYTKSLLIFNICSVIREL